MGRAVDRQPGVTQGYFYALYHAMCPKVPCCIMREDFRTSTISDKVNMDLISSKETAAVRITVIIENASCELYS